MNEQQTVEQTKKNEIIETGTELWGKIITPDCEDFLPEIFVKDFSTGNLDSEDKRIIGICTTFAIDLRTFKMGKSYMMMVQRIHSIGQISKSFKGFQQRTLRSTESKQEISSTENKEKQGLFGNKPKTTN